MKIEKDILIRPMFIKTVLKSVNSFSFQSSTMSFGKLFHVLTIREQNEYFSPLGKSCRKGYMFYRP